jgi:2-polyprenyl-6-methoxyphenol hydroxylase-like FAD-dependent oxidoreductase
MEMEVVGAFASGCIPGPALPSRILAANNHPQPTSTMAARARLWEHSVMSNFLGRRAVVIGAGIGGLAAAGALAKYLERVEILERDQLTASAGSRSGTPQDRHPHGLLAGGLRALDQIFPGFKSDLAAAGAVPVSFAREVQFERPDVGVLPKRDFGISVLCATRPLIERVLRRRAEGVANITLRPTSRVIGIVPAAGGASASGVQFVSGSGRPETLDADLVVDASGRGAPTLALLDALGWERPQMTEIGVDISYNTAVVQMPPDATAKWKLVLTLPDPPHLALHAVLCRRRTDVGSSPSPTIARRRGSRPGTLFSRRPAH